MVFKSGNEVAKKVHYWLARLIREDKDHFRERFNTPTSENDERFKELFGLKKKPYLMFRYVLSLVLLFGFFVFFLVLICSALIGI
jgi:hypothetical protein